MELMPSYYEDEIDERGFWLYGPDDDHDHIFMWSTPLCVVHCVRCGGSPSGQDDDGEWIA